MNGNAISNALPEEAAVGTKLYSLDKYEVIVVRLDDADAHGGALTCYGVFNTDTGIREAEFRGYPHAMTFCRRLQDQWQEVLEAEAEEEELRSLAVN